MDFFKISIIISLVLGWYAEWRIHRRNYKFLRDQGAVESSPRVSQVLYLILKLAPIFIVFEGAFYPTFQCEINYKVFFTGLLALSSALRWWAIDSVNMLWTYRCLAHPQMRHYALGPYRFLSHPEYFSRLLDLVSLSIIFDGPLSGLVFGMMATGLSIRLAMAEQSHYLVVRSLKSTG